MKKPAWEKIISGLTAAMMLSAVACGMSASAETAETVSDKDPRVEAMNITKVDDYL